LKQERWTLTIQICHGPDVEVHVVGMSGEELSGAPFSLGALGIVPSSTDACAARQPNARRHSVASGRVSRAQVARWVAELRQRVALLRSWLTRRACPHRNWLCFLLAGCRVAILSGAAIALSSSTLTEYRVAPTSLTRPGMD
jgi:hypothetical protein